MQETTYQATARKWRPLQFKDMVGQEHVASTLRNAIVLDRVHHAYLFTGPRGVGKTTSARLLAKAVNCMSPGPNAEPCNVCESCLQINGGRSIDVVEIDGASNNSVEDVRKLRENAKYPPSAGKYKLYIIDEVHMLSTSAFNALLKTLEEPPDHLVFVFATTEVHKVPATILSRCQRYDFKRMELATITSQLSRICQAEDVEIDEESLVAIARKADGSMRDSQSILDQVRAYCGSSIKIDMVGQILNIVDTELYFDVSDAEKKRDIASMFKIVGKVRESGYDLQEFFRGLVEHYRNILLSVATGGTIAIANVSKEHQRRYVSVAGQYSRAEAQRLLSILLSTEQQMRSSLLPHIRLEMTLTVLASLDSIVDITSVLSSLGKPALGKPSPGKPIATGSDPVAQTTAVQVQPLQQAPQVPLQTEQHVALHNANAELPARQLSPQFAPTIPANTAGSSVRADQADAGQALVEDEAHVVPVSQDEGLAHTLVQSKATSPPLLADVGLAQPTRSTDVTAHVWAKAVSVLNPEAKLVLENPEFCTVTLGPRSVELRFTSSLTQNVVEDQQSSLKKYLHDFAGEPVEIVFAVKESGAEPLHVATPKNSPQALELREPLAAPSFLQAITLNSGLESADTPLADAFSESRTAKTRSKPQTRERSELEQKIVDLFDAREIPLPSS